MAKVKKREQIMSAAEKLFTSRRVHEITMDEIATAAHVGKGTIYRYFADKDELFFQVATSGFEEMCRLLKEEVPGDAPFTEQLVCACGHIAGFFERRRQLLRMMQAEDGRLSLCHGGMRDRWMSKREELTGAVAEIMETGQREGCIPKSAPAGILANFLLGMLRTRARYLADAPDAFRRDELIVSLFLNGASGLKV